MKVTNKVLDGTTGGVVIGNWRYPSAQIAIKGRTSGNIHIEYLSVGSEDYEEFSPVMNINLTSGEYTAVIPQGSIDAIRCTPNSAGDDFEVTLVQTSRGSL